MNRSNLEHALFALLIQFPFGLAGMMVGGWMAPAGWWIGAAAGAFFFLGREHAQFEKHLTHGGPVDDLNPLAGFAFWKWSLDSRLDLLFPILAVLIAPAVCHLWR